MTGHFWVNAVPGISNFFTNANASVGGDDPDPKINKYVEEFTAAYGPTDLDYSTEGYTAAEAMFLAVERAGRLPSQRYLQQQQRRRAHRPESRHRAATLAVGIVWIPIDRRRLYVLPSHMVGRSARKYCACTRYVAASVPGTAW
jgi:hypothetical protein